MTFLDYGHKGTSLNITSCDACFHEHGDDNREEEFEEARVREGGRVVAQYHRAYTSCEDCELEFDVAEGTSSTCRCMGAV